MIILQLNVVRQIAEEEFERAVAVASDADVTVVLIGTTEEVFNERDEAVWRMSASLIEEAHRASRKVGLCGQAPSNCPDFAAFLVHLQDRFRVASYSKHHENSNLCTSVLLRGA